MSDELKILLKRPRREYKYDLDDQEEAATLGLLIIKTPSRILTLVSARKPINSLN